MAQSAVHTQPGAMQDQQPVISGSSSKFMSVQVTALLPDGGSAYKLHRKIGGLNALCGQIITAFHHFSYNPSPGVKRDEQAAFDSSKTPAGLTDRHTQNYTLKSSTPRRAALLDTY